MAACGTCVNWEPLDGQWGQAIYETQDTSALSGRGCCVKSTALNTGCHLVRLGGPIVEVPIALFPVTFSWMRCGEYVQVV